MTEVNNVINFNDYRPPITAQQLISNIPHNPGAPASLEEMIPEMEGFLVYTMELILSEFDYRKNTETNIAKAIRVLGCLAEYFQKHGNGDIDDSNQIADIPKPDTINGPVLVDITSNDYTPYAAEGEEALIEPIPPGESSIGRTVYVWMDGHCYFMEHRNNGKETLRVKIEGHEEIPIADGLDYKIIGIVKEIRTYRDL